MTIAGAVVRQIQIKVLCQKLLYVSHRSESFILDNYILIGGIVMATASELRERIRELEAELEEKDEIISDLQDTIDKVYELVSPESEDEDTDEDDDLDSDEIEV